MKIVVGGQIDKEDIAAIVKKELGDQAEVTVKGDLDATMGMKAGTYDYYVGACNTCLLYTSESASFRLRVPGEHNVLNALASVAMSLIHI